jgi:hypothetical protein
VTLTEQHLKALEYPATAAGKLFSFMKGMTGAKVAHLEDQST